MNLRNLQYFVGVAETRSVSAAAALLHRSQPAVSRAIQELESELGVQLFAREARRVALTPDGLSLLRLARVTLHDADELLERARELRTGQVAVLRVGTAASTIESVLPRLIRSYREVCPTVELTVVAQSGGALLEALERGELDVVLTRHTASELLDSQRLFPAHIVAIVHRQHAFAKRASVTVEDLARERLLVAPPSATSRMLFDLACADAGVRPTVALESQDLHALTSLSEVGYGVTIALSTVSLRDRPLKALPIRAGEQLLGVWTGVVWNRRRQSPAIRAFVETAVREHKIDYPGKELRLPPLPPNVPESTAGKPEKKGRGRTRKA